MQEFGYKALLAGAMLVVGAAGVQAQRSGIPVRKDVDRSATMAPAPTTKTDSMAGAMAPRGDSLGKAMAPGRTEMMSAGDVALGRSMTDPNITDHLIAGDSMEIAIAQLAQMRSRDQRVRDYAAMLVRDHTVDMQQSRSLGSRHDIGRGANPADSSGMHMMHMYQMLQSASAADFDRMFLSSQVHHHVMELTMGDAMRQAARDDDLQHHLDDIKPILTRHRDQAAQVASAMGIQLMPMRHDMQAMPGMMKGMQHDSTMVHDSTMAHDTTMTGTRPPR